ncbi:MAG: YciI family protein [Chitinophagaceae bacterium]
MEKFMLIFHGGQMNGASPEQMQAQMGKWMAWIDKLNKTQQYVTGEPLIPGGKTIKGKGGKTVTDGPYTEGKEVVGGFFIIKAKDINEAVAISKDYPDFDSGGTIQLRQVMKVEM